MKVIYSSQTKLQKKNTKIGLVIGAITGLLIGLTVGVTVFTISGASLSFAIGITTAFAIAIALGGAFMGLLFDLDARERNADQAIELQPEPVIHRQIQLQPTAKYLL